jgi:hypothetical protein
MKRVWSDPDVDGRTNQRALTRPDAAREHDGEQMGSNYTSRTDLNGAQQR